MKVVSTRAELRAARSILDHRIGLVPTMGALHDGHLTLVRAARAENTSVIASIFVNPTQFGPNEDLAAYPRTLETDLSLLEREGVDIVFTPTSREMYPAGFQTSVDVADVSQGLEGARRPGHFRGVATVVAKLFNLTEASTAYFGQKDAQQVVVIRRMVADLNFPTEIIVIPTMRETDGLAMSSRNRYLTPEQRAAASVVYRALQAVGAQYEHGVREPTTLRATMVEHLRQEPLTELDYVSIADPVTLVEAIDPTDSPVLASLTVKFGATRLLDNALLPMELNDRHGLSQKLGVV
jgi:pantoate--beta-alanine ligase